MSNTFVTVLVNLNIINIS